MAWRGRPLPCWAVPFLDCVLLFLLTAALIWPLFHIDYFDNWMSIEGSFIADARYIRDHFPHPKWHALWYGGTRFDYIYPPFTRFGAALVSMALGVIPARGYHIYIAMLYCAGVAGVYFLVWTFTRRRWTAWFGSAGFALLSPVFVLFPAIREDSPHWMPQRLNVLVKWGEGPHMDAFALLPFAIGLLYLALKRRSPAALAGCAIACAAVVSNNLYGAVALGIFFPVAVWSIWLGDRDPAHWIRAAGIVVLSGGLCAWWLTPSFVRLTARNLMLVAQPGNAWSKLVGLSAAILFLAVSWRFVRTRRNVEWSVFLGGSLFLFGLGVCGHDWFGFRIVGEPMRFVPELDLLLILVAAEGVRRLTLWRRWVGIGVAAAAFSFSVPYLRSVWDLGPIDRDYRKRVEYRLTEWVAKNLPGSRTFATGSVRFWYTTWRDLPQLPGASDQGMESLMPALAQWQIAIGSDVERDIAWLVATGCDALITHEARSQEIYHHIHQPRKYMGHLPVIYDSEGDIIYRVPRRSPGLARVVDESRMASLEPVPWNDLNRRQLAAYAAAAEESEIPVEYRRVSITEMRLRTRTQPGESILVQETWDPGWRAYDRGVPLEIRKDVLDQMRLQALPGEHDIRLVYEWPLESRAGHALTWVSLLVICGIFGYSRYVRYNRRSQAS